MTKVIKLLTLTGAIGLFAVQCLGQTKNGKVGSKDDGLPWFRNSLYGVSFETPKKVKEIQTKPPVGYEEIMMVVKYYRYFDNDFKVTFSYTESKFTTYDKEVGLKGAIGNVVNKMKGTGLELNFHDIKNQFDDLSCDGTFQFEKETVHVKGYIYWNSGKIISITTIGTSKYLKDMERVINGLRISIL